VCHGTLDEVRVHRGAGEHLREVDPARFRRFDHAFGAGAGAEARYALVVGEVIRHPPTELLGDDRLADVAHGH